MNSTVTITQDIYDNYTISILKGKSRYVKATIKDIDGDTILINDIDKCSVIIYKYVGDEILASPVPVLLDQITSHGQFIFNITPEMTTSLGVGKFSFEIIYTETSVEISGIKGSLIIEQ